MKMEYRDPISHAEEISTLKRFFNNRYVAIIGAMLLTAFGSVVLTAYNYSNQLDGVVDQNKIKAYNDSVAFSYIKEKNETLINALQTSNNAIINQSTVLDRMQVQLDYVQRDVEYVRKRIDNTN